MAGDVPPDCRIPSRTDVERIAEYRTFLRAVAEAEQQVLLQEHSLVVPSELEDGGDGTERRDVGGPVMLLLEGGPLDPKAGPCVRSATRFATPLWYDRHKETWASSWSSLRGRSPDVASEADEAVGRVHAQAVGGAATANWLDAVWAATVGEERDKVETPEKVFGMEEERALTVFGDSYDALIKRVDRWAERSIAAGGPDQVNGQKVLAHFVKAVPRAGDRQRKDRSWASILDDFADTLQKTALSLHVLQKEVFGQRKAEPKKRSGHEGTAKRHRSEESPVASAMLSVHAAAVLLMHFGDQPILVGFGDGKTSGLDQLDRLQVVNRKLLGEEATLLHDTPPILPTVFNLVERLLLTYWIRSLGGAAAAPIRILPDSPVGAAFLAGVPRDETISRLLAEVRRVERSALTRFLWRADRSTLVTPLDRSPLELLGDVAVRQLLPVVETHGRGSKVAEELRQLDDEQAVFARGDEVTSEAIADGSTALFFSAPPLVAERRGRSRFHTTSAISRVNIRWDLPDGVKLYEAVDTLLSKRKAAGALRSLLDLVRTLLGSRSVRPAAWSAATSGTGTRTSGPTGGGPRECSTRTLAEIGREIHVQAEAARSLLWPDHALRPELPPGDRMLTGRVERLRRWLDGGASPRAITLRERIRSDENLSDLVSLVGRESYPEADDVTQLRTAWNSGLLTDLRFDAVEVTPVALLQEELYVWRALIEHLGRPERHLSETERTLRRALDVDVNNSAAKVVERLVRLPKTLAAPKSAVPLPPAAVWCARWELTLFLALPAVPRTGPAASMRLLWPLFDLRDDEVRKVIGEPALSPNALGAAFQEHLRVAGGSEDEEDVSQPLIGRLVGELRRQVFALLLGVAAWAEKDQGGWDKFRAGEAWRPLVKGSEGSWPTTMVVEATKWAASSDALLESVKRGLDHRADKSAKQGRICRKITRAVEVRKALSELAELEMFIREFSLPGLMRAAGVLHEGGGHA